MDYSTGIDALAFAEKLAVENSGLSRDNKEWVKLGIEGAQTLLKAIQPPHTSNMAVMGFTLEQIACIKDTARYYGLKRVVIFPYIVNGQVHSFMRMYQGDIGAFCSKLGSMDVIRVWGNVSGAEEAQIDEIIKTYGVIVYERECQP